MTPYIAVIIGGMGSLLLGIAVLVAQRLILAPFPGGQEDSPRLVLRVIGWGLIVLGFVVDTLLLFLWLGPIWWIAVGVIALMAYCKQLAAERYALLGLMAAAADRNMPLAPAIEAFSGECGGRLAWRAHWLAHALSEGMSLPEACARVRGAIPPEALPLVRVGHETGSLAPALRQAASARDLNEPIWQSLVPKIVYLCFLPWIGISILTFIMLKIVPQFEKIFKDFGTTLPPMTRGLISAARYCGATWPLLGFMLMVLWLLLVYVLLRYAGAIHWDLPGTGWLSRRLDSAAILDVLAIVAARQQPLDQGLAALADCYPKWPIRRRLYSALDDVKAGADWCGSLLRRGLLGGSDAAVLQAAARAGNLSWAMREMADSNRRRFAYRTYALVQLLFPPVVLGFGMVGMFIVVALFMPLVALIHQVIPL